MQPRRNLLAFAAAAALLVAPAAPALASKKDPKAVLLAMRSMEAMGGQAAFDAQRLLRFDFAVERDGKIVSSYQHWWDRATGRYRLEGKTKEGLAFRVLFNVNDRKGQAWLDGKALEGKAAEDYVNLAYERFINDTYWLLMPWKWLDPGVTLAYDGEREVDGKAYEVALLTFDAGVGLTSNDRYWGFVSRETGRVERWEYVLQKEDGTPGDGPPNAFLRADWKEVGGGVTLSTRMERLGPGPKVAIVFPVCSLSAEVPDDTFTPILRPPASEPPAGPAGRSPNEAGVKEVLILLHKSDHTATLLETQFLEVVGTLPTGLGPHEGLVSKDGRTLYVANYGTADRPGNSLTVIDIPSAKVLRTVDLGEHRRPHGLALAADGSIYVTSEESKSLLKLAAVDQAVEKVFPTGQEISHMVVLSPDGKRAYTANIGSGSVTAIDLLTGKATTAATGKGAEGIDVTPDGKEIWVAHREEGNVKVLDAETLAVLATVPTGKFPIRVKVTPDGKKVLVTCAQSNELQIFDRALRVPAGQVSLDPSPIGILIAPGGEIAFIACTQSDQVALVDINRNELLGYISAGHEPDGMAWARW